MHESEEDDAVGSVDTRGAAALRALRTLAEHPAGPEVLSHTPRWVVLRDKYPKARVHLLVLPRPGAAGPSAMYALPRVIDAGALPADARARLAGELAELADVARGAWAAHGGGVCAFEDALVGFHALPSLTPLHLHLVSPDLVSESLKTKKHLHSFSHAHFFLRLDAVLAAVRGDAAGGAGGGVLDAGAASRAAAALKAPLACPRCGSGAATMPALKAHLSGCGGR